VDPLDNLDLIWRTAANDPERAMVWRKAEQQFRHISSAHAPRSHSVLIEGCLGGDLELATLPHVQDQIVK